MGKVTVVGGKVGMEAPLKVDPVFANNDWATIVEAVHKNKVPETWVVGDQKNMKINGVDYPIDIIGKNHDSYSDGSGKAPLTFQLHDCYGTDYAMNSSSTNYWVSCTMRTTRLPAILALMPSEVQSGIREVNKLTSAGNMSTTINTNAEKLFLLAEIEVSGSASYSVNGEGTQYDYYKAGNATTKTKSGNSAAWFLRSPYREQKTSFCNVGKAGGIGSTGFSVALSVSFAFCF